LLTLLTKGTTWNYMYKCTATRGRDILPLTLSPSLPIHTTSTFNADFSVNFNVELSSGQRASNFRYRKAHALEVNRL